MSQHRVSLGKTGEDLACQELERRGYAIVARRYRRRGGELDIIARDGKTMVFVEVKAREGRAFGEASEAVTARKRVKMTPNEVLAYRQDGSAPNAPGWDLRVVPNKFPALQVEGTLDREGEGMFDRMNGIGAHEVIIETPHHDRSLAAMSEPEIERVLWAYRERILDLKRDGRRRYILVFKNNGAAAGATLAPTHTQR